MTPHAAFLRACALDVAVRKPGNVSAASPGHGMAAADFLASAEAAAPALTQGGPVGARIEAAVAATWARVGCNTNLGILLLCAPLAAAAERAVPRADALRGALTQLLAGLTVADSAAVFRAIARAQPGGLGVAPQQDVREPPTLALQAAMALAQDRDRIARWYVQGGAELWDVGLAALDAATAPADSPCAVQAVYLAWLASAPDTHLVRKHGEAAARAVMREATHWQRRAQAGADVGADAGFADWDERLKRHGLNPGTSADFTVATLMLDGLLRGAG